MKRIWFITLSILGLVTILVWYAYFSFSQDALKIISCDVGQGDATLITQKDFQILIDGGPNNKVLQCLSANMPFWDRVVDVVILSHPQKDHFAGLIDVFQNYDVKHFIATPLDSGSLEWRVLEDLVGGSDTKVINPVGGEKYRLGLIYLDILYPSKTFLAENLTAVDNTLTTKLLNNSSNILGAYTSKKDPNEFSLVLVLSYKNFGSLFTGDIGPKTSDDLAKSIALAGKQSIEYIKVPHHGSKNGLSKTLIDAVEPAVAVISVGKDNSYGHPHREILKILGDKDIRILRTDLLGDIEVVTDGEDWWVK